MARPRKYNVTIPGLSCYTDVRTKKVYWRYKHPITGKFHGLGTDEEPARAIAIEANSRLSEQKMNQLLIARDKISKTVGEGISVNSWLKRYWEIQEERCNLGEIKPITLNQKKYPIEVMRQAIGNKDIMTVTVRDIIDTLHPFRIRDQNGMAKVVRSVMSDVFQEAQQAGEVSPGFNPAKAAKAPKTKVKRQRLTIDEWRAIYELASGAPRYLQRAMLLAVVTGQRLGDISNMKFADIWDNRLHVIQSKTGARIAIPLHLRCDELGMTLEQVISLCRDRIVSPYLLHHHHTVARAKRGGRIQEQTISGAFSDVREASGLKWENGTPPTFHEQRSLSERLYRIQGIDTKVLLGHKSQQMTDEYNDDRGREWAVIAV
ncbi:phage integrase Arm DNA-binding domain-containing protein [Serratia bockelmannii]|uniref:phage integrase Arm DNA-binding domain-containing protein n=1 Tax=Serratia bockelmannii TaxID=2703793 RepID=UPI003FA6F969